MTAETSPGLDIVSGSSGVRADSVQKENEMRQDRAADEDAAGASAVKLAPTTPPRVTTSAPYSTNRYSEDKPRVNLSPFAFGVSNPDGCSGADGGDVAPPDDGPHPSQKSPHCGVSGPQPSHAAGKEAVFDLEDAAFSSDYFRMYEFKVSWSTVAGMADAPPSSLHADAALLLQGKPTGLPAATTLPLSLHASLPGSAF